jgi:hypothetical protein
MKHIDIAVGFSSTVATAPAIPKRNGSPPPRGLPILKRNQTLLAWLPPVPERNEIPTPMLLALLEASRTLPPVHGNAPKRKPPLAATVLWVSERKLRLTSALNSVCKRNPSLATGLIAVSERNPGPRSASGKTFTCSSATRLMCCSVPATSIALKGTELRLRCSMQTIVNRFPCDR